MTEKLTYRFLLADDHSIVRNGLNMVLNQIFDEPEVVHASNFVDVQHSLYRNRFDLLILDISFPEGNSLKFLPILKQIQPWMKILVFSSYDEDIYAMRYIKAGANGYLSKLSNPDELEVAIHSIMNEGNYTSKKVQDRIIHSFIHKKAANPLDELSDREMEIATMLVNGYGNLEISNELNLKATTVSTYKYRVFDKLRVDNIPDLIQAFNLHQEKIS